MDIPEEACLRLSLRDFWDLDKHGISKGEQVETKVQTEA